MDEYLELTVAGNSFVGFKGVEDPLTIIGRARTKLNTLWMKNIYPFASFGSHSSIHPSCEVSRRGARFVSIGDDVYLAPDVWLNAVDDSPESRAKIVIRKGCQIGRRSTISARNCIELEEDVLLAPNVLLMDHNHEYSNPNLPIHKQGVTQGGTITVGRNSWLGYGCVLFCSRGELSIGKNSIVGANSVVTRSFPECSIVAGNPARLIKHYDPDKADWIQATLNGETIVK